VTSLARPAVFGATDQAGRRPVGKAQAQGYHVAAHEPMRATQSIGNGGTP
jgi:hypothetical protein